MLLPIVAYNAKRVQVQTYEELVWYCVFCHTLVTFAQWLTALLYGLGCRGTTEHPKCLTHTPCKEASAAGRQVGAGKGLGKSPLLVHSITVVRVEHEGL